MVVRTDETGEGAGVGAASDRACRSARKTLQANAVRDPS
ncbi:MAG: hypothetical protein JWP55_5357 [Mycobacterium sp.]|nr:hypothetical protein [Mycobacterium sp.]